MEEELLILLRGISELTNIIPEGSIRWGKVPQSLPLPYIVLTNISDTQGLHLNGVNQMTESRVQIDIYALSYSQCKLASRSIKNNLNGYRQGNFRLIEDNGSRDFGQLNEPTETDRAQRISNDFIINWRQLQ